MQTFSGCFEKETLRLKEQTFLLVVVSHTTHSRCSGTKTGTKQDLVSHTRTIQRIVLRKPGTEVVQSLSQENFLAPKTDCLHTFARPHTLLAASINFTSFSERNKHCCFRVSLGAFSGLVEEQSCLIVLISASLNTGGRTQRSTTVLGLKTFKQPKVQAPAPSPQM